MTIRIIILGTGGNCIDILDTLNDVNAARGARVYECAGFLDDAPDRAGAELHGVKVLGPLSLAPSLAGARFVNGIGSPDNFWNKPAILAKTGLLDRPDRFETIIHPTASVSSLAHLGRGTVVLQHVTIASNARVGAHVIVLPNSVVSHDVAIGDFSCVASGACLSGGVTVGPCSYVGANACVRGGVTLGRGCLVGLGSVVLTDVADDTVVVGNPARVLRKARPQGGGPA